jgi:hypothetical protein
MGFRLAFEEVKNSVMTFRYTFVVCECRCRLKHPHFEITKFVLLVIKGALGCMH